MTKSRFCISSDVFFSSHMESLSEKARLLYCCACAESDLIGEIKHPRCVTACLQGGEKAFNELVGAGFIVAVDDGCGMRYFIKHHFLSNTLKNKRQKEAASSLYEQRPYGMELDFDLDEGGLPRFRGAWRVE